MAPSPPSALPVILTIDRRGAELSVPHDSLGVVDRDLTIIAMVCSAGGLAAVTDTLALLPATLPAAIVLLQHSDPHRKSQLAEILQRFTPLVVLDAVDDRPLAVSEVVVAPSGYHTLITPHLTTALIESGSIPPNRPSGDLLLTTLAMAAGGSAVAVIMTGSGTDGATGATAVHRFGGTVIVTSPASSSYTGMPEATIARDHITDAVVETGELASFLIDLVAGRSA